MFFFGKVCAIEIPFHPKLIHTKQTNVNLYLTTISITATLHLTQYDFILDFKHNYLFLNSEMETDFDIS